MLILFLTHFGRLKARVYVHLRIQIYNTKLHLCLWIQLRWGEKICFRFEIAWLESCKIFRFEYR